jgi:hypothetical protein
MPHRDPVQANEAKYPEIQSIMAEPHYSHTPAMDPALVDELSERMLGIAREVFGRAMVTMIAKGSAIKGDFIPDFSDFDLHIFADESVMRGPLIPSKSVAIPFQEYFSAIDIRPYRVSQIQVMVISAQDHPRDWIPAQPGSFRLIYGQLPDSLPEVTDDLLTKHAHRNLSAYRDWVDTILARIIDKSNFQLADNVRLAGTIMKAALYEATIVLGSEPQKTWYRPLSEILDTVEPMVLHDRPASRYYDHAWRWAASKRDADILRLMLSDALKTLDTLSTVPDLPYSTDS